MFKPLHNCTHLTHYYGEGNGTPLQYSCLENPMDGGAWKAAVHGVAKSRTQLRDFPFTFTFMHWRRKWQATPVFLSGESQGWESLVGCRLWGRTELGHDWGDLAAAAAAHTTKVVLKFLQARLQQHMNHEFPDVQAGFRKGRGTRDQIANICWIIEKAREFQKTSTSALLTTPRPLIVWITINFGKFWKRWEYQTTWPASWEIYMQVRKQQLELDIEQQTGSK